MWEDLPVKKEILEELVIPDSRHLIRKDSGGSGIQEVCHFFISEL